MLCTLSMDLRSPLVGKVINQGGFFGRHHDQESDRHAHMQAQDCQKHLSHPVDQRPNTVGKRLTLYLSAADGISTDVSVRGTVAHLLHLYPIIP